MERSQEKQKIVRMRALVAGAIATVLLGGAAQSAGTHGSLAFARKATYSVARGDHRLDAFAVADLNGDGRADAVTADTYSAKLHVQLARANGALRRPVDYPIRKTGDGIGLQLADLTGDGRPEVIIVDPGKSLVWILLNHGNGTFAPRVSYPAARGADQLAVAGLNGDGSPDLAVAGETTNGTDAVSVLLNRGDGTFAPKQNYPLVSAAHSIAVGDLNGDGRLDLAVGNGYGDAVSDSVSTLLNRGDGTFLPRQDRDVPGAPDYVVLSDLTGDGKADLIAGGEDDSAVWVFLNDGDGTFGALQETRTGGEIVAAIATADLNGDGHTEVVVADEAHKGAVSVLVNRGDGTSWTRHDYPVRETPDGLSLLDLNGDGKLDIASFDRSWDPRFDPDQETVSVLLNRGSSFAPKRDYLAGLDGTRAVLADVNGDGRPDLATASNRRGIGVSVRLDRPGLCNVQDVVGLTYRAAARALARVGCRAGSVRHAHSSRVRAGGVISESPRFGAVRSGGTRVDLVVSLGR
jgi:FG-GAP-like repeat/PASTA domain